MVFLGVGGNCSSQHEITFVKLYCFFYLIKLTKFLRAHEGSVKDLGVGEEPIAQYWQAVLNTQGIRNDSKEKHEYNLKDFQPKRRKLPND